MKDQDKDKEVQKKPVYTKEQMDKVINRTIELLQENKTPNEIIKVLQGELGRSKSQCEVYLRRAREAIKENYDQDRDYRVAEFYESLLGDLKEAKKNYEAISCPKNRMKGTWFRIMMEVKDRISKYHPEQKDQDESQTIKIEYKVQNKKEE